VSKLRPLTRNRLKRVAGFIVGIVLFYAPFALLARGFGALFPTSAAGTAITDVHAACLRMPLGWLVQPWMWPALGTSAISWLPIAVLPISAIAVGPMFCGWLCPAGLLPEHLGRLVPDRFKFDFKDRVSIVPLRYGFLAGFLVAPFISASICCSFCNFTHMQNLVSGMFGNPSGLLYFSTLGVLAAALWIVPLGLFTKGGRGWCMFLCPAGTVQGFASAVTAKLPWTRRMRVVKAACADCGTCADACPMRAITLTGDAEDAEALRAPVVDHHLCNECHDCVSACPAGALRYGTRP
jgi:ferredoxin-type protein NapH